MKKKTTRAQPMPVLKIYSPKEKIAARLEFEGATAALLASLKSGDEEKRCRAARRFEKAGAAYLKMG